MKSMANKLAITLLAFSPGALLAQDGVRLMDRQTFVHLMVDEFELSDVGDENDFGWDADLWVGGDLHRFWMKTEGERGDADSTEVQLLYSKAILPVWDLQAGWRRDIDPAPDRDWAVIALNGLAPYFFEVEAELFLAEGGQTSVRVKGEYELMLTQRVVLTPELEFVTYGRSEPARGIGSGLSEIGFDLRLRYELKREFAPYVGLAWQRSYGATRELARAGGHDAQDVSFTLGLRGWF